MSGPENWQPGDLALCIKGNVDFVGLGGGPNITGPRTGAIYIVKDVRMFEHFAGAVGLMLAGWRHWLHEENFRRIEPREADEFDREVIELMAGKPVREDA